MNMGITTVIPFYSICAPSVTNVSNWQSTTLTDWQMEQMF